MEFFLSLVIVILIIVMLRKIGSLNRKLELYNDVFHTKLNLIHQSIQSNKSSTAQDEPGTEPVADIQDKAAAPEADIPPVVKDYMPAEIGQIIKPATISDKSIEEIKLEAPDLSSPEAIDQTPATYSETETAAKLSVAKADIPAYAAKASSFIDTFFNNIREIGWEQWLGTRGILLAGIITTLIGGGFFAKYASEHGMLGPIGRACMIAGSGLLAIIIGEFTRRRDFGIVARGLTALGFALLYCSTFASYQVYEIIGSKTAFALSLLITVCAMSYSVSLDERLSAFVALLGGYLSPAMLSSGHNSYNELFTYLTILSAGAMLCANYRKWRAVNWLAFIGTAICYCGWASKYDIWSFWNSPDSKLTIAASMWAGVFFLIFLILPVLHEFRTGKLTKREDIALILSNGLYSLFIFASLLSDYRKALAMVALGMAAAHLGLMAIMLKRNRKDTPLQAVLFALSIFFTTVSLPIFFDAYALTIAWAAEGVILSIIAYQYKSKISEFGSIITFFLTLLIMLNEMMSPTEGSVLFCNKYFISLFCSSSCYLIAQYLYRRHKENIMVERKTLVNMYYFLGITAILTLCLREWYYHCDKNLTNIGGKPDYIALGSIPMIIVYALAASVRPLRPATNKWLFVSSISGAIASAYAVISAEKFYNDAFTIFFNLPYSIMVLSVLLLFAVAYIVHKQIKAIQDRQHCYVTAFIAITLLWVLTTMQINSYWDCKQVSPNVNSDFMATMYISVFWAIYASVLITIGFWKKFASLRYAALGLFALTLGKVFIYDMSNLANIYRIAGFVVLGVLMVAVSFLYQYARKKGIIGQLTVEAPVEAEKERD